MEAISNVKSDLEKLISECLDSLPTTFLARIGVCSDPDVSALNMLIERARQGGISTLPYVVQSKETVHWVSFGGNSGSLLEYAEDLRSWVLPGYRTHGELNFARSNSQGRLANLVLNVSPPGYLRWASNLNSFTTILKILDQMHGFLNCMPVISTSSPPSIHILRFRFVSALKCGDWDEAEQVINDIDRWNLEQAHKTMQMRLRLLGESRKHAELLEMVETHGLWVLTHPTRVSEAIIEAVINEILKPLELQNGPDIICQKLQPWLAKLTTVLPLVSMQATRAPLFAYFACIDDDGPTALSLLPDLASPLLEFVRERFQKNLDLDHVEVTKSQSNQINKSVNKEDFEYDELGIAAHELRQSYWSVIQTLVRQGSLGQLELLLSELDARVSSDSELLGAIPELVMDLISDPIIGANSASRNALHEVLSSLVDLIFSLPGFPDSKYIDIYLSVAEAMVYVRGDSASEEDAHLLHGLLAAIANLSTASLESCTKLLRSWWQLRPVLPRLDWLLAVLESLAPLHPKPDEMVDLWVQAVGLAHRKHLVLTPSKFRQWTRVAGFLELDPKNVTQDLESLSPLLLVPQKDALANVSWRKIAIVSLQENAAREAARELHSRTNAEVIVVTSLVQDGLTKTAKTADVILLVWAACSHAVYRAFDDCRSRLVYVQGTGTTSIVTAAEQMAEKLN